MLQIFREANNLSDPLLIGSLVVGTLVLLFVLTSAVVICKRSKKKKMVEENMAVDENPVYQQYELVGPNYERQYSTHEVVDSNNYYE